MILAIYEAALSLEHPRGVCAKLRFQDRLLLPACMQSSQVLPNAISEPLTTMYSMDDTFFPPFFFISRILI